MRGWIRPTWHLHPMTWHLDPIRGRVDAWDLVTDLLAASPLPNPVVCHVSSNDANESSDKISRSSARARLREWRVRTSARPRLGGRVEFEFGASVLRRRFRREGLRGGRRGQGAGVGDGMAAREGGRRLACLGAVAAAHGRRRS